MPNPLDIIGGGLFGGNMDDSFMKGMQMAISMENMKLQRQQAQERIDLQKLNAEYMRDLTRERTNALQSAIAEKNRMTAERSERTNLLKPVISKDYGNIPAYEPPGLEPGQYAQPLISETPSRAMKAFTDMGPFGDILAKEWEQTGKFQNIPERHTTPEQVIGDLLRQGKKEEAIQLKRSLEKPPVDKTPVVKSFIEGDYHIDKEWNPETKQWVEMSRGLRYKPKEEKPENPLKAANEELTVKNKIEGVIGKQLSQEFGRDIYDPILQTFTWDVPGVDRERVKARYNELKQTLYKQYGLPLEPTMTPKPVMDAMPDAKIHKGRTIADTATGKRYRSNGIKWMEIK